MSDDKAQLVGDGNEDQYYPQHAPPVYQAPSPPVQIQPGPEQPYVAHVHQYDAQPMQNPPNDYLVHSILACIFCCWPLGLVAIIKALDQGSETRPCRGVEWQWKLYLSSNDVQCPAP
ncbi:uncharacterized protein [Ptychodera flava]|uniref:uncharacterized protein isoform X2 n=1 Tax=Ptychodera flava TaxID=63121 RepID=UPI00396A250E